MMESLDECRALAAAFDELNALERDHCLDPTPPPKRLRVYKVWGILEEDDAQD